MLQIIVGFIAIMFFDNPWLVGAVAGGSVGFIAVLLGILSQRQVVFPLGFVVSSMAFGIMGAWLGFGIMELLK